MENADEKVHTKLEDQYIRRRVDIDNIEKGLNDSVQ